jgi:hypothetical protein
MSPMSQRRDKVSCRVKLTLIIEARGTIAGVGCGGRFDPGLVTLKLNLDELMESTNKRLWRFIKHRGTKCSPTHI